MLTFAVNPNIQIVPVNGSDNLEHEWRFRVSKEIADHVFKYVEGYTNTFRDAQGDLPPGPALSDWECGRYAWATVDYWGLQVTKVGDHWELGIMMPTPEGIIPADQWIDVLSTLKKVSHFEYK